MPWLRLNWIRRFKHLQTGVEAPGNRVGNVQWVLSRPLYRFSRFDLSAVPVAQRTQALRLQIDQWAPFVSIGCYVIWEGALALVWAWNAVSVDDEVKRAGLKPKAVVIIPETLLHEKRVSQACIQQSMEGFEGQYWQHGVLSASRWWPTLPSLAEWVNFQRDAGLPPSTQSAEIPKPVALKWAEQPWKKPQALDSRAGQLLAVYQWGLAVSVLGLVFATAWIETQLYGYKKAIQERQAQLQKLVEREQPLNEARAKALDTLNRIQDMRALFRQHDVLGIMAKVADTLPKDGTYLRDWELQGDTLRYQLVSPKKLSLSEYLKQVEMLGLFNNVQASPANDPTVTMVEMQLVEEAAVKFDAEAKRQ